MECKHPSSIEMNVIHSIRKHLESSLHSNRTDSFEIPPCFMLLSTALKISGVLFYM